MVVFLFWYSIYATSSLFLLWVFYLAIMNLKSVKDTKGLNAKSQKLGGVALVLGYILDANAILA